MSKDYSYIVSQVIDEMFKTSFDTAFLLSNVAQRIKNAIKNMALFVGRATYIQNIMFFSALSD